MKKTILLDLTNIKNPTCGFGQIAVNYAKKFSELRLPDLKFAFVLPEGYEGKIEGEDVDCYYVKRRNAQSYAAIPKVDLWHCLNQNLRLTNGKKGQKQVLTIHDLNYLREKGWLSRIKHKLYLRRQIRQADAITTISHFVADEVKANFQLGDKPMQVIYNGVERIDVKPQQKPAFVTERPFFFAIGQVRMKKNFHLLLDVMKAFPDKELYIAGDDHFPAGELIHKRIEQENITNVHLVGKVFDPERTWLYAHCEAFLFPSQGEGFGLPVIEAMQFSRAVFVAPCTCLPEIAGDSAYVWKDLRTETLVEGIRQYLPHFYDDTKRLEAIKEYALTYSYERHIEQYIELYRKLLVNHP